MAQGTRKIKLQQLPQDLKRTSKVTKTDENKTEQIMGEQR